MEDIKRACTTCVFCLRRDYGYSNWTTEGTTLSCLAGLNDELDGQEEPYREIDKELAKLLDVALTCPKYKQGAPATLDVDQDAIPYGQEITKEIVINGQYTDDEEAAQLLADRLNSKGD